MPKTAEQAIYDRLHAVEPFHPSNTNIFASDWALEPGDVVTVKSGEESYSVPVYSMDLQWNGAITTEIQSTGNQERKPLPALQRREYANNARSYGMQRDLEEVEEEFQEFETWRTETDELIGQYAAQYAEDQEAIDGRITIAETAVEQTATRIMSVASATGVLLDENGNPVLDAQGHYTYNNDSLKVNLFSQVNQTATAIDEEVSRATNAEGVLTEAVGAVKVTADSVSAEVISARNGSVDLASRISVINGAITQEVTDRTSADTTLTGLIQTEAGKISQIVTAVGSNGEVTAASIVTAINTTDGSSLVAIDADHVYISGNTQLSGKLSIDQSGYLMVNGVALFPGNGTNRVVINNGTITASNVQVSQGGNLTFIGSGSGEYYQLNATKIPNFITALQLVAPTGTSNTYTLQKQTVGSPGWTDVGSFSRATSLTGGWSGGTYTVEADPQGNEEETTISSVAMNGVPKRAATDKHLNVPVKVMYQDGTNESETGYTGYIDVDGILIYQDGYSAGYDDGAAGAVVDVVKGSWTSTGITFSPSQGSGNTAGVVLSQGTDSYSNGIITIPIYDGTEYTEFAASLSVRRGAATPNTPVWDATNHQYTLSAGGSFSVGNSGNIFMSSATETFTPTDAINYGRTLVEQRTATGLADTITLSASDTGTSNHSEYVLYDDDSESSINVRVNASSVYEKGTTDGFTTCYDSIGLSATSQTIAAGSSITIYPKAKSTKTASSASNITSKGITITAASGSTTQRTATGLASTIMLTASETGASDHTVNVNYDDGSQSSISARVNASSVYAKGFDVCHDSITLSHSSGTLSPGQSITIYPRAKASVSSSTISDITSMGITITAPSFSTVSMNRSITSNGTYTYTPSSGYDGISDITITVNVPTGGGGGTGGTYTGYIMSKFIKNTGAWNSSSGSAKTTGAPGDGPYSSYGYVGTIDTSKHGTGGYVNLRSSPSGSALCTVPNGATVHCAKSPKIIYEYEWMPVQYTT